MSFVWSESAQRFRDSTTGKFVPTSEVNAAIDTVIRSAAEHLTELTQELQAHTITLAQWQTQVADELKMLHVGAAALGRGGWAQMSQSDWGWTGARLRAQYAYLRNFAHDIATGKQPMDGRVLARAAMYAEATRTTEREMMRRTAAFIGRTQEKNQLGYAEHCEGCVQATAMGWVPIGTLPPIGGRQCRSRCHCVIITRREPESLAAA